MAEPDRIIEVLIELNVKNRDVQFAGARKLTSGFIERRYVGCVDVEHLALRRKFRERNIDYHDLGTEQGTDPNNVGFVLRVIQHEPGQKCACKQKINPWVWWLLVIVCCVKGIQALLRLCGCVTNNSD